MPVVLQLKVVVKVAVAGKVKVAGKVNVDHSAVVVMAVVGMTLALRRRHHRQCHPRIRQHLRPRLARLHPRSPVIKATRLKYLRDCQGQHNSLASTW